MKEVKSLRKGNEKHFSLDDGTYMVHLYNDDVHYKNNDEYIEIDNTIDEKDDYYENRNNDFKVKFSKEQVLVKTNYNGDYINITLNDATTDSIISKDNKITYKEVYPKVDVSYEIIGKKIKETIKLQEYIPTLKKISYIIETNLVLELKDNIITAYKDNKLQYILTTPFMKCRHNEYNYNSTYELYKDNNLYILDLILDTDWLHEVEYPVLIDPTLVANSSVLSDTYITNDNSLTNIDTEYLKIGVDSNNRVYRTLIKFSLPELASSAHIISAYANLVSYKEDYRPYDLVHEKINIHMINSDWSSNTVTWEDISDKYDEHVENSIELLRSKSTVESGEVVIELNTNSIDITNAVKKWYTDTPNYGIMLKFANEEYNPDCKEYYMYSKEHTETEFNPTPYLIIHYRNYSGIVEYLDYSDYPLVFGSVSVNNYTGNMISRFDINETVGGTSPLNLALIYDTQNVLKNATYYRFNFFETIEVVTLDDIEYLSYIDSTGANYYFYKNDENKYISEDGLNYEIIFNDTECTLKDLSGNEKIFTKMGSYYYLTTIKNLEGSTIDITITDGAITAISDEFDQVITINYATDKIIVNSSFDTATITLSEGRITGITNKFGNITLTYNSDNLIENIYDIDGEYINLTYYTNDTKRVKMIKEYGTSDKLGKTYEYTYNYNNTIIKDNNANEYHYIFNDRGNLLSYTIFDESALLKNAYGYSARYSGGTNVLANRLLSQTQVSKYTENLIINSSFERPLTETNMIITGVSIQTNNPHIGKKSLKLSSNATFSFDITEEDDYTISFYLKTDIQFGIYTYLYSIVNSEKTLIDDIYIYEEDYDYEYKRYSLSGHFPVSTLQLQFEENPATLTYLDDIQLERGLVANDYNLVENSSFKEGINSWNIVATDYDTGLEVTDNIYEIVSINESEKAIKINSIVNGGIVLDKVIEISGKSGDVYTISFWYKNQGILENTDEFTGNIVNIRFIPEEESSEGSGTYNVHLNRHSSEWLYFSETYVADYDYSDIEINLISQFEANSVYITNVNLIKDLGDYHYNYDSSGKLIATYDMTDNSGNIIYDENNQYELISNSNGEAVYYEYDNTITDRQLRSISKKGFESALDYNSKGQIVKMTLSNRHPEGISDNHDYNIRFKGSNYYLDVDYDTKSLTFKEKECSNQAFKILSEGEYYEIVSPIDSRYKLLYTNLSLKFIPTADTTLYNFIRQSNGSYYIQIKDTELYLKNASNSLIASELNYETYKYEFYLEDTLYPYEVTSEAIYDENDRFIVKRRDSLGHERTFSYASSTGLLNNYTNALGISTTYTYDSKGNKTSTTKDNKTINYTYNNSSLLTNITSGTKNFSFEYDDFSNIISTKINDTVLATYTYADNDGPLTKVNYGNNTSNTFSYDSLGRINKLNIDSKDYDIYYNNRGDLAYIKSEDEEYRSQYDYASRLNTYEYNKTFKIRYKYDEKSNLSDVIYTQNYADYHVSYDYDDDNELTTITYDDDSIIYDYDYLSRLRKISINDNIISEYNYLSNGKNTSFTLETIKIDNDIYRYQYDNAYNITKVLKNENPIHEYTYDNKGQLLSDIDYINNEKRVYTYDSDDNITSKKTYNLTDDSLIENHSLSYNNSNWHDQLTSYDTLNISYDNIGNPTNIGDDILSWSSGRRLKSYKKGDTTINYKYDFNGNRIQKKINDNTIDYYLEDDLIIFEKRDNDMIYYLRDSNGHLIGFEYNSNRYYYQKNFFEDIIGIYDDTFNLVVSYEYDAWGELISIKDSQGQKITDTSNIGYINPFRYRSYYYDSETNLYYLKNRYYNPLWKRFLNPDGIIGTTTNINNYNLYNYVDNNPIAYIDDDGNFPFAIPLAEYVLGLGILLSGYYTVLRYGPGLAKGAIGVVQDISSTIDNTNLGKKDDKKKKRENKDVYVLVDNANIVQYVGISNDPDIRLRGHQNNRYRKPLTMHVVYRDLSKIDARMEEEKLILQCKTLDRGNRARNLIHSISPSSDLYKEFLIKKHGEYDAENKIGGCEWDPKTETVMPIMR